METVELYELLKELGLLEDNGEIHEIDTKEHTIYGYNGLICKISEDTKSLKSEYEILGKLKNLGPFPIPVYYGKLAFEKSVLITSKIIGDNVKDCWGELESEEKNLLLNQIVDGIKTIHSIKIEKNIFYDYLREISQELINLNTNNQYLSEETLTDYLEQIKQLLSYYYDLEGEFSLIHNDLLFNNILVQDKQLAGILDFDKSIYGPKFIELFSLYNLRDNIMLFESEKPNYDSKIDFINKLITKLKSQYGELFEYHPNHYKLFNLLNLLSMYSEYDKLDFDIEKINKFKEFYGL